MENTQQHNLIVKVVYKKLVFNYGKNIDTYTQLVEQTKKRFPDIQNYQFVFNELSLTNDNFSNVIKKLLVEGQKSIKLEIKELPVEKVSQKNKSKKFSFDPNEFEDVKKEDRVKENQKQLESEFQQLKIGENQVDPDSIQIRVLMGDQLSSLKIDVGSEYKWSCTLINKNSIPVPKGVFIIDISTNKFIDISGMGPKQAEQIHFGPYVQKQVGKFTRLYQIVYKKNEQSMSSIGKKFGFVCEVTKKISVKELQSKVPQRIKSLRNFLVCEKSTQYIVAKLKQAGITAENIDDFDDQCVIDIIEDYA